MTTIIVDIQARTVYADSLTTVSNVRDDVISGCTSVKLKEVTHDGEYYIITGCGDKDLITLCASHFQGHGSFPSKHYNEKAEATVVVISQVSNSVDVYEVSVKGEWFNKYKVNVKKVNIVGYPEYLCLGSGGDYVRAFLHTGFTPDKAIKETAILDRYTNDEVKSLSW